MTIHTVKPRVKVKAISNYTNDSFENVLARLGVGESADNLSTGSAYVLNPQTRYRWNLEMMYRGSWLVGNAVDCVADDMTRAGIDLQVPEASPDQLEEVQAEMVRLHIWQTLAETIKWGRLYGGALAVQLVDGQDTSTPLIVDRVGKDQYKGILALDRWSLVPSVTDYVTELGPRLGEPKNYEVMVGAKALAGNKLDYTRATRIIGIQLPYWQSYSENGWGLSVVERIYDRLVAFDSTTQGAAQMVYRAHLRTLSVENLRDILAIGGPAEDALIKMMNGIRKYQTMEGLTLIDTKDKFDTYTYTFAGMDDIMIQMAQQLSGALQIPLVRLFGQSPAGLNSSGEADIRTYYDLILQQQEAKLRVPLDTILRLIWRSKFGKDAPKKMGFTFRPLWQMTEKERSEVAKNTTDAVVKGYETGIVDKPCAMRELRDSAEVTGVWASISDDDIKAAEEEAEALKEEPPVPEEEVKASEDVVTEEPEPEKMGEEIQEAA